MNYVTRDNLNARFGADNVTKWADLDDDGDTEKIALTISEAIADVSSYVDSRLRGGPYRVPFDEGTVPREIVDIVTALVGERLYDPRQTTDAEKPTVSRETRRAEQMLTSILSGTLKLDSTRRNSRVPGVLDCHMFSEGEVPEEERKQSRWFQ